MVPVRSAVHLVSALPAGQVRRAAAPVDNIVAWAPERPALMRVPSALVTWTLAIPVIEPMLRMPSGGAT